MFARWLLPFAAALLGCASSSSRHAAPEPVDESSTPDPVAIVEPPPSPEPRAAELASVRPLHQGRVLLTTAARPEWATGPVLAIDGNEYHEKWALDRAADVAVLPPELSAYFGMMVDLYGPAGRQCTVVLHTLTIEAHLPMEYVDGEYVRPGAEALWRALSADTDQAGDAVVLLVASFAEDPSCQGALWARDASLPAPSVLMLGDEQVHAALLAEQHRDALATEAGQEFASKYQEYAADDEFEEDAEPWASVSQGRRQVWIDLEGNPRLVAVNFGDHSFAPCRWPGPAYGFARQLGDALSSDEARMLAEKVAHDPAPVAVFDADLDGRYELLILQDGGDFTLVRLVSLSAPLQVEISLPDHSWVWC